MASGGALAALDDRELFLSGCESLSDAGDDVLRDAPQRGFDGERWKPALDHVNLSIP
jgi:hypothetical protein